uniref:Small ribosomal subunit protein uS17 N-terminal domain-containing protein n=1 Tax=Nelumbo nucifera TaxID=4432 RepID=A0A822ZIT3_NELNU|nr:TPA_asm: hypothetical protein HUJ06_015931 [Nelumbo nucifera]
MPLFCFCFLILYADGEGIFEAAACGHKVRLIERTYLFLYQNPFVLVLSCCLVFTVSKRCSSKRTGKGKRPGKGGNRFWKSIGLGFKTPREAIEGSISSSLLYDGF